MVAKERNMIRIALPGLIETGVLYLRRETGFWAFRAIPWSVREREQGHRDY